jgi:hypothetical protein
MTTTRIFEFSENADNLTLDIPLSPLTYYVNFRAGVLKTKWVKITTYCLNVEMIG